MFEFGCDRNTAREIIRCSCITSPASLLYITPCVIVLNDPNNMPDWTLVGPDCHLYEMDRFVHVAA